MDKLSAAELTEISYIFAILNVDGSGLIAARQLQAMMSAFGYVNSEEDIQGMIDAVDTDGSGMMDFPKFCAALLWNTNQIDATTQTNKDDTTE